MTTENLPAEHTDEEEVFQYEGYDEEIKQLHKYRDELDELFADELADLKEIKSQIKRSKGVRGGLTFITAQTSNLIALKNSAISTTNMIISAKSKETSERLKINPPKSDDSVSIETIQKILDITNYQSDIANNQSRVVKDITPKPEALPNELDGFDDLFEGQDIPCLIDEEKEAISIKHMIWVIESENAGKWALLDDIGNLSYEEITEEMPEPENVTDTMAYVGDKEFPVHNMSEFIKTESGTW